MSLFKKAAPEQARLKISMYGPPGSGKTFTTLLMAEGLASSRGGRVAFVDTERGTDFYAKTVPERQVHPDAFDFDALYTRSLKETSDAIRSLKPEEHAVVVIDSISHMWEAAIDAYGGRLTKAGTIPMHAWGKLKKPYKDLIKFLLDSSFDVFILGRQKNMFEEDEATGNIRKVGVGMRAEGETPYEPHICLRMEAKQDEKNSLLTNYLCYAEKDRTGVLSGKTFTNPSFQTIAPLLPLLGETQAQLGDEEERIANDGELLDEIDEKKKQQSDKSAGLFSEFQAAISKAASTSELGAIAGEVKKKRRYLNEEHRDSLLTLYNFKRDKLVEEESPDVF